MIRANRRLELMTLGETVEGGWEDGEGEEIPVQSGRDGRAMKVCTKCGLEKPETDFHRCTRAKDGLANWCKVCVKAYHKHYAQTPHGKEKIRQNRVTWFARPGNLDRHNETSRRWRARSDTKRSQRSTRLKAKYSLTLAEYEYCLQKQGGTCLICGDTPKGKPLFVDHDHKTGAVRGLLCAACNHGLGRFKAYADVLQRAIEYLRATRVGDLV